MGKVQLYTCESGVSLFEKGYTFGAWTKESKSYKDVEKEEYGNISIFIEESDIESTGGGEFRVISIKSVEIIG